MDELEVEAGAAGLAGVGSFIRQSLTCWLRTTQLSQFSQIFCYQSMLLIDQMDLTGVYRPRSGFYPAASYLPFQPHA